jgi:hypothetical protein
MTKTRDQLVQSVIERVFARPENKEEIERDLARRSQPQRHRRRNWNRIQAECDGLRAVEEYRRLAGDWLPRGASDEKRTSR